MYVKKVQVYMQSATRETKNEREREREREKERDLKEEVVNNT